MLVPAPTPDAVGVNEPATVELDPGEKATVTYQQKQRVSSLRLPIIAISKFSGCVYEIRADGKERYGPAEIPPTDIDDLSVCFLPALHFEDELTIEVTNLGEVARTIHMQPIGWEPEDGENA